MPHNFFKKWCYGFVHMSHKHVKVGADLCSWSFNDKHGFIALKTDVSLILRDRAIASYVKIAQLVSQLQELRIVSKFRSIQNLHRVVRSLKVLINISMTSFTVFYPDRVYMKRAFPTYL